jgi:death on curing protein
MSSLSGINEQTFLRWLCAYAFHICQNHPFIDGNKRVGLSAALVFLDLNGIRLRDKEAKLYDLMMEVAKGKAGKPKIASKFRELAII